MSVLRRSAAIAAAAVVLVVATGGSTTGARPRPAEGHYLGVDDIGHPVAFMANEHRIGNFHYGDHDHALGSIEVTEGSFRDCLAHVCFHGAWSGNERVVGVWHEPHHHRRHAFAAELVR